MRVALLVGALTLAVPALARAQGTLPDSADAPGLRGASPAGQAATDPPVALRRLGVARSALALYAGYGGGVMTAVATGLMMKEAGSTPGDAVLAGLVAYPLAAGGIVYGVGRAFGAGGSLERTLAGAAVGAGIGAGVMLVAVAAAQNRSDEDPPDDTGYLIDGVPAGLSIAIVGVVLYAVGPPVGALVGFSGSARPAALVGSGGHVVLGASLRVRF